jgi:hypothetical protein
MAVKATILQTDPFTAENRAARSWSAPSPACQGLWRAGRLVAAQVEALAARLVRQWDAVAVRRQHRHPRSWMSEMAPGIVAQPEPVLLTSVRNAMRMRKRWRSPGHAQAIHRSQGPATVTTAPKATRGEDSLLTSWPRTSSITGVRPAPITAASGPANAWSAWAPQAAGSSTMTSQRRPPGDSGAGVVRAGRRVRRSATWAMWSARDWAVLVNGGETAWGGAPVAVMASVRSTSVEAWCSLRGQDWSAR